MQHAWLNLVWRPMALMLYAVPAMAWFYGAGFFWTWGSNEADEMLFKSQERAALAAQITCAQEKAVMLDRVGLGSLKPSDQGGQAR